MNIEYVLVNDEGVVHVPPNSSVAEINGAIRKHVSTTHGCEAHCIVLEKIPNKSPMYLVLIDQGLQSFRQNGCTVDVVDGQPLTDAQKDQVQKEIRKWIIRKQIRVLDLTDLYVYFGITKMIPDAFDQCASLTSLILPDGLVAIGEGAFDHCTALTTVAMPAGLATIGASAFYGCTSLARIALPDTLTTIDEGAFYGCTSLVTIVIPDSVSTIGAYAFKGCAALTTVAFVGSIIIKLNKM